MSEARIVVERHPEYGWWHVLLVADGRKVPLVSGHRGRFSAWDTKPPAIKTRDWWSEKLGIPTDEPEGEK